MKKLFSTLAALAICAAYTGCENGDLWDANNELEGRVDALEQSMADAQKTLQQLLQKLDEQVTIDNVTANDDGCTINFSDGTTVRIRNGADGADGDTLFKEVNTESDEEVVFTLSDGRVIVIPRTAEFKFEIECDEVNEIIFGRTRRFAVTSSRVDDCIITHPCGWTAILDGNELVVTAPVVESIGEIAVMAVSTNGISKIVKMQVSAIPYPLRVLTFEDEDYKGSEGNGYWSSLIDSKEYGGELLYGDMNDWMAEVEYQWTDENNTFLYSGTMVDYGFSYMLGGGSAISDYTLDDIRKGDYTRQLSVLPQPNGRGGHNGSSNFCVFFDGSGIAGMSVPMVFADGEEHIIDHMYVTTTVYTLNSLMYGDGFSQPAGDDGWFAVTATGYDMDDEVTGTSTFYLCKEGKIVDDWTKWDLSSLGRVLYVEFKCSGSDTGAYGLNTPAYFAYDDVAVRFED